MKLSSSVKISRPEKVAAALVLLLILVTASEATISCGEVGKDLAPCVSYLKTNGAKTPSDDCCKWANAVVAAAKTKDDKQAACECIKTAAKAIKADEGKAKAPPTKCKISLPYNISLSMDCSKYYSV